MVIRFHNRDSHHEPSRPASLPIEELLTRFSAKLTASDLSQIDSVIESGLLEVLNLTGSGCVCWYEQDAGCKDLKLIVYSTDKPELELLPSMLTRNDLPYALEALSHSAPTILRSLDDLPGDASKDREFLKKRSIWGMVLAPSDCGTQTRGVIAVVYLAEESGLTDSLITQLTALNNLITTNVERKRLYDRWHESETRLRWLLQNIPIGIAIENLRGNLLFVNPALCSLLGYSSQELLGMRRLELPAGEKNDHDNLLFQRLHDGLIDHYRTEREFVRKDGMRIWGRIDVGVLNPGSAGNPLVIRMVEDITQERLAGEELLKTRTELEDLAGHLIQAQEEERHRISRELHDDIGQRVSLLSIEFDSLSQSLAATGCDTEVESIFALKAETDALVTDLDSLSHRLHSTRLQHLGLHSAIEDLTKQLSKQHQISINLSTHGRDTLLPPDVALCLFRVAQEALNNAIRHSKAQSIFIELNVGEGVARLEISDTGVGFDVSGCEGGMGLVSMRERLRMIGGEFSFQSRRGKGTLVTATVPYNEVAKDKVA